LEYIYQAYKGGVSCTKIKSLCRFMYNHHTLHASMSWDGGVSHTITRSL